MGVVYQAEDTHLDRTVAIKVRPADAVAGPERRRGFAQEAKAASALNQPNIMHVYDISPADDRQACRPGSSGPGRSTGSPIRTVPAARYAGSVNEGSVGSVTA